MNSANDLPLENSMSELHHECGVAAIYQLPDQPVSEICPGGDAGKASTLISRMLLDMQNRGQLSAGISRFHPAPENGQLIDTCLLYTSPSPRDQRGARMPSSA